jgi:magnesium-protoporphyrin O-methyltransferase
MNCCQCQAAEALFDDKTANRELKKYRRKGPDKPTRLLIDALKSEGIEGMTLLDVGGGVGAIHHELLGAGVARATDVDASSAYLAVAREESAWQGHADRVSYQHGDFVELAPEIEGADIVTLDRVICCYPDMLALVGRSAARAAKLYGAVYPRDRWWVRMGFVLGNFFLWLTRNPFRTFAHPTDAVEGVLREKGLEKRYHRNANIVWQVVVFARNGAS